MHLKNWLPTSDVDSHGNFRQRLINAGLRPTKQRLFLSQILFGKKDRHFTAEQIYHESQNQGESLSLATVYNNLNQFLEANLIRQVMVGGKLSFFDTNVTRHHHFYHEETGDLYDIPADEIKLANLPSPPEGTSISEVEVIIRIKD